MGRGKQIDCTRSWTVVLERAITRELQTAVVEIFAPPPEEGQRGDTPR